MRSLTEVKVPRRMAWRVMMPKKISTMFSQEQQGTDTDRREVDPPIVVETARWSKAGQLDWWVKERREWWGRVRGADSRQRWIRAADLRPARNHGHDLP
jgi:hypothetical protein